MAKGRYFPVQQKNLGPRGTVAGFNETALPFGSAGQLGEIFEDDGKLYRLVKHDNGTAAVATAAGFVAHWKDKANFVVTSDQTDAELGLNGVAGAYLGVITDGNYCFIQMGGRQEEVLVAASTAVGDQLSGSATDGTLARTAASTACVNLLVAIAVTDIDSGTSTVDWVAGALI